MHSNFSIQMDKQTRKYAYRNSHTFDQQWFPLVTTFGFSLLAKRSELTVEAIFFTVTNWKLMVFVAKSVNFLSYNLYQWWTDHGLTVTLYDCLFLWQPKKYKLVTYTHYGNWLENVQITFWTWTLGYYWSSSVSRRANILPLLHKVPRKSWERLITLKSWMFLVEEISKGFRITANMFSRFFIPV